MRFNIHKFLLSFSRAMKRAAFDLDMNISTVAEIAGVPRNRVAWYWNYKLRHDDGEVNPRIGEMVKLLEAVQVEPKQVFRMLGE